MSADEQSKKILIIGLDGATYNAFDDGLLSRYMPNLNSLKMSGTSGVLRSTEPPITWAAWTSFLTGCRPAGHGIVAPQDYNCRDDRLTMVTSRHCHVPNIWQELTAQGYRVISINVPWTHPCPHVNGIVVAGYGCPGPSSDMTWPPEFKSRLLQAVPDYEIFPEWEKLSHYSLQELDIRLRRVERSFRQRIEAVKLAVSKVPWDIMMVHFQETDLMAHRAWPLLDKNTRGSFGPLCERIGETFGKLDAALAYLLEIASNRTMAIVVSDHGLCRKTTRVKPNGLLCMWGYLKRKGFVNRKLEQLTKKINGSRSAGIVKQPEDTVFDWKNSRAMVITMSINAHLYLNVKGRQPLGTVEPGADYDAIVQDLRHRFTQLLNPSTNRPVFARVGTSAQIYGTQNNSLYGDLILVPAHGVEVSLSDSGRSKVVEQMPEDSLVGIHDYDGIYMFAGQQVVAKPGDIHNIIDIAPTIYAALGAKLPNYMDGKVLTDVFRKTPRLTYQTGRINISPAAAEPTESEQAEMARRLAALGYIE
jgi:predicted AlkP superfamily phosphohydrolase/phosphomutase